MSNSVVYQTQMTRMLHFINFDCILILYMSVKCVNMYKPNNKRDTIRETMKKYVTRTVSTYSFIKKTSKIEKTDFVLPSTVWYYMVN